MVVRIGSNSAALSAQRRIEAATAGLARSTERLASGLRINRAADDAAGLAISTGLRVDGRVYSRALQNLNDGLSAVAIAEGALQSGSQLAQRLRELALQASNGTFSLTQRRALDNEADQLVREFSRIISTTRFNGRSLLQASPEELRLQLGYGADGTIGQSMTRGLSRREGTGSFGQGASSSGGSYQGVSLEDLNRDGTLDILSLTNVGFVVRLGNGDGTFGTASTTNVGATTGQKATGDFDGDGNLDVLVSYVGGNFQTFLGNGNGTFRSTGVQSGIAYSFADMTSVDLNGDGRSDLVGVDSSSTLFVRLSNGDGTFGAATTVALGFSSSQPLLMRLEKGDFDSDGRTDILVSKGDGGQAALLEGDGRGGLNAGRIVANIGTFNWFVGITGGDFNGDGLLDFAAASGQDSMVRIYLNQGEGNFSLSAAQLIVGSSFKSLRAGDIDGDGMIDLVSTNFGATQDVSVLYGSGDGTVRSITSFDAGVRSSTTALGDINGDGVSDLLFGESQSGATTVTTFLSNTTATTTLPVLNLNTRTDALAALGVIEAFQNRITDELGRLGSFESRLVVANRVLEAQREQFAAADSRISSADVAEESATVTRQSILQRTGAAVLAQANQLPALALQLLRP